MKFGRICTRVILGMLFLIIAGASGGAAWVYLHPQALLDIAASAVNRSFPDIAFKAKDISLLFSPLPGTRLNDVNITLPGNRILHAGHADVRFKSGAILHGRIVPAAAHLSDVHFAMASGGQTLHAHHAVVDFNVTEPHAVPVFPKSIRLTGFDIISEKNSGQGLFQDTTIDIDIFPNSTPALVSGNLSAVGHIRPGAEPIPFTLHLPFDMAIPANHIGSVGARLTLENDSLSFAGVLNNENLIGRLNVNHLSLPRWFAFARHLPNGLAGSLNNLEGAMDIVLNKNSLIASNLSAKAGGITLFGSGQVKDFSKPVIEITAAAAKGRRHRLETIMPELLGKAVKSIVCKGLPLECGKGSGPSCDIRLSFPEVQIGLLETDNLSLRIIPGKLIASSTGIFDGQGSLALGFSQPMSLEVEASNIDLALLTHGRIYGRLKGRSNAKATLSSIPSMLASFDGCIDVGIEGLRLDKTTGFDSMTAAFKGKGTAVNGIPHWIGEWRTTLMPNTTLSHTIGRLDATLRGGLDISPANGLPCLPGQLAELLGSGFTLSVFTSSKDEHGNKPIPTAWMHGTDISGLVRLKRCQVGDISLTDLALPVSISSGRAKLKDASWSCLGGSMNMTLDLKDTGKGLQTQVQHKAQNISMAEVTKNFHETKVHGNAFMELNAHGLLVSSSNLLHALDGQWSVHIGKGSMESMKNNKITDTRQITDTQLAGKMHQGLLTCSTIRMQGPGLFVRGSGVADLVHRTAKYQLTASVPKLPDIPLSYSGPLGDPKRSIDITGLLGNIFHGIGTGIRDLAGTMLNVPRRLFDLLQD